MSFSVTEQNNKEINTEPRGHKRGRSSLATTGSNLAAAKPAKRSDRTAEQSKFTLKELVAKIDESLTKYLVVPTVETAHLWLIQALIEDLCKHDDREKLRDATWWFLRDMNSALGLRGHARYIVFIDESRALYNVLREQRKSISDFESSLFEFQGRLKDQVAISKKAREKVRNANRRTRIRKEAKESGRRVVGETGVPLENVLCLDIETGRPIHQPDLFGKLPPPGTPRDPDSIPEPARSSEFKGFVDAAVLQDKGFRIYTHGTIYWFSKARDGRYYFVLGAMWRNHDEISGAGREHLDRFVCFAEQSVKHSFKVEKNWAQNRGKEKHGEIYMSGWHSSMRAGDSVTAYAPRPGLCHASDFDAYLDMNRSLKDALNALTWAQETEFAPNIADYTKKHLSSYGLPMAGSLDINFESHEPSLGSSLSLSRHDPQGRNYANGMHTDRDIDGHKLYQNVAYTTGAWCFGKDGRSVGDIELIKKSFTPAYLIFPKYRIALDLNSRSFLMSLWRGGLDAHGTTPSRVDLASGLTRWGCSVQSNWGIPARLASENRVRRNSDAGVCQLPTRKGPVEMVQRRLEALERRRRNSVSATFV